MRRGELCGLTWQAVDLERGVLRVVKTRLLVDGEAVESPPKTSAGRRQIALDEAPTSRPRALWARQAAEKLAAGSAYNDQGYLLCDPLGEPPYPDSISESFDERVKALGLRRVRLHDLRHSCASLLSADGVPVKVVAELLGHDPRVTLATYQHVLPGQAAEATASLSAKLLG